MSKCKSHLKKFWHFLWEEDSLLSWVVNIVLAFIIIKFLVYPGLGFILGTTHPIVAVVSGSMEHHGSFDTWWQSDALCDSRKNYVCAQQEFYNSISITKEDFQNFPFKNGFNKGDIIILFGTKPQDIKAGDVIVFNSDCWNYPIIHRVVYVGQDNSGLYYTTKGDFNPSSIVKTEPIGVVGCEAHIPATGNDKKYIGEAQLRIPYLGWIKIWFVDLLNLFHIGGV